MKSLLTITSLVTLGCMLPLSAQVTETTQTTDTTRNADGTVTETTTTTTRTFTPEVHTKVVTYFDGYKGKPYGLPPGFFEKVRVKKIPAPWRTARITPGVVLTEEHRSYIVPAPPELVEVLPAPTTGIRYYVAGSNVVAVDRSYKVVDSVQIPSIKFGDDDDEVEIEVDKDDDDDEVEVEIERD